MRRDRGRRWKRAWDDRRSFIVQNYDYWYEIWMPHRQEVLDLFAWLKSIHRPEADRVLDLGAGTGAVALRFLRDDPAIEATLIDGSRPQLATARRRFREAGRRARFLYRDLDTPRWSAGLGRGWPLVVSNAAIHHLPDVRKARLFREIRRLLAPGGLFLYGDIVKFDDLRREDWAYEIWNDDIREKFITRRIALRPRPVMKQKLIEAADRQGDIPATVEFVLDSLDRAGFRRASLVWFYLKYAVFMAVA